MENQIFDPKNPTISKIMKIQKRHFQAKYSLLRRDMAIFMYFWPFFGTWRSQFWRKNKIVLSLEFARFRRLKCRIERPDWTSRKPRMVERKILYFLIFGVRLLASCGVSFEKKIQTVLSIGKYIWRGFKNVSGIPKYSSGKGRKPKNTEKMGFGAKPQWGLGRSPSAS